MGVQSVPLALRHLLEPLPHSPDMVRLMANAVPTQTQTSRWMPGIFPDLWIFLSNLFAEFVTALV